MIEDLGPSVRSKLGLQATYRSSRHEFLLCDPPELGAGAGEH